MWKKLFLTGCIILIVAGSGVDIDQVKDGNQQKEQKQQEEVTTEKNPTKQKRSAHDFYYSPPDSDCEHDEEPAKKPLGLVIMPTNEDLQLLNHFLPKPKAPTSATPTTTPSPLFYWLPPSSTNAPSPTLVLPHNPLLDLLLAPLTTTTTTTTTPPPPSPPSPPTAASSHYGGFGSHDHDHDHDHDNSYFTTTTTTTTPAPLFTSDQLHALLGRVHGVRGLQSALGNLFPTPHSRSSPSTCDCIEEINQLQHAILLLHENVRQLRSMVDAHEAILNSKTKIVTISRKAVETE